MIKRTLLFSNPARLSLRNKQLVINLEGENGKPPQELTRPIEDIGVVIIESHCVTLTSALLSALLSKNVAVITCDKSHLPEGLLLNLSGNMLQSERFLAQIGASLPLKKQLWQQTVQAKISNQAVALKMVAGAENGCMIRWVDRVKSGDSDNLEGRAAAYYWRNLFPKEMDFRRDRDGAPPNHLLNYGYIVLRGIVARSLVGSGLLPTLGIHHRNRYNAYCLADDIMEPYRPFVDIIVADIVKERGHDIPMDKDAKQRLLQLPTVDVMIDGRKSPLMVATQLTTASLAQCYSGERRKLLYPNITPTND